MILFSFDQTEDNNFGIFSFVSKEQFWFGNNTLDPEINLPPGIGFFQENLVNLKDLIEYEFDSL